MTCAAVNFNLNPDNAPTASTTQGNHTGQATAIGSVLRVLLCPSDFAPTTNAGRAVHNYPLNTGTTFPVSPRNPQGIPVTGIFFENSVVRHAGHANVLATMTIWVSGTTVVSNGTPGVWDGVSFTTGFVLALAAMT